jgi:hypothetical protein
MSAVAERESSTYLVWRNEYAPPMGAKARHEFNMGSCVVNGQTREQKYERQSGVFTKSARRRFRTQYLRFVER